MPYCLLFQTVTCDKDKGVSSGESTTCLHGKEDELLSQAIALSEENENENDEEELLRQAIALSLEDSK